MPLLCQTTGYTTATAGSSLTPGCAPNRWPAGGRGGDHRASRLLLHAGQQALADFLPERLELGCTHSAVVAVNRRADALREQQREQRLKHTAGALRAAAAIAADHDLRHDVDMRLLDRLGEAVHHLLRDLEVWPAVGPQFAKQVFSPDHPERR